MVSSPVLESNVALVVRPSADPGDSSRRRVEKCAGDALPRLGVEQDVAMGAALQISLHTGLSIEECQRHLTEAVDFPRRTLFSLSGYQGRKRVLGWVDNHEFELHKRKYYRNDFAPVFLGALSPESHGTRIEGYFDCPRWIKIFWRFWCASVFLIVVPVFFFVTRDILRGR